MQEKLFTVSYSPSSSEYQTVAYAADPEALYVKIVSVQVSNTSNSDRTLTLRWGAHSDRVEDSSSFWGDGTTLKQIFYTYPSHQLIVSGYLPAGASLSLLDKEMFLKPKDFITIKPSVAGKMITLITVAEYFSDEISEVETRIVDYNQVRKDFEDDVY